MHMRYFTILFVFFMTTGCSDFPTAGNSPSFVGVHAVLNPQLEKQEVYVSRAFNLDAFEEYSPDTLKGHESGAVVTVSFDTQSVRFIELTPGYYQDTAGVLKVISGRTYSLNVVTANGEKISATTIVPFTPTLTAPVSIDTFHVDIAIDTTYHFIYDSSYWVEVNMRFLNAPLLFQWNTPSSGVVFYFRIGSDTMYVLDHQNGDVTYYDFSLIVSQGFLYKPELLVFDQPNARYGDNWSWTGFLPDESNIIEGSTYIQIQSFDFSVTNDSRRKIISNINGGFGFFGSMNNYRKPVYFIITPRVVI